MVTNATHAPLGKNNSLEIRLKHALNFQLGILMTLCLMVRDWLVFRAEPMPSCWPNLHFFWLLLIFFFLPTGLICGVGVNGLIECS